MSLLLLFRGRRVHATLPRVVFPTSLAIDPVAATTLTIDAAHHSLEIEPAPTTLMIDEARTELMLDATD